MENLRVAEISRIWPAKGDGGLVHFEKNSKKEMRTGEVADVKFFSGMIDI